MKRAKSISHFAALQISERNLGQAICQPTDQSMAKKYLNRHSFRIDYLEIADAETLDSPSPNGMVNKSWLRSSLRILNEVRLIDK